jgi:hypothetical protein
MVATLLMYNKLAVKLPVEDIAGIESFGGEMLNVRLMKVVTKDGNSYKAYHVLFG